LKPLKRCAPFKTLKPFPEWADKSTISNRNGIFSPCHSEAQPKNLVLAVSYGNEMLREVYAGVTRHKYDLCGNEPLIGSACSVPMSMAAFDPVDSKAS